MLLLEGRWGASGSPVLLVLIAVVVETMVVPVMSVWMLPLQQLLVLRAVAWGQVGLLTFAADSLV